MARPKIENALETGVLARFRKIERKKVAWEINTEVLDLVNHVAEYIAEVKHVKPTLEEVIEELLKDGAGRVPGFNLWHQRRDGKVKTNGHKPTGNAIANPATSVPVAG